jgi:hypothetical protein
VGTLVLAWRTLVGTLVRSLNRATYIMGRRINYGVARTQAVEKKGEPNEEPENKQNTEPQSGFDTMWNCRGRREIFFIT